MPSVNISFIIKSIVKTIVDVAEENEEQEKVGKQSIDKESLTNWWE